MCAVFGKKWQNFYPRPPRGGRPALILWTCRTGKISIHALREEGDVLQKRLRVTVGQYFYPRPPRGGRREPSLQANSCTLFLSTPSARRATLAGHIPGRDAQQFLSTPSARRATTHQVSEHFKVQISIHALREEGDRKALAYAAKLDKFLSTPSARRATAAAAPRSATAADFYPRPPRGGRPPAQYAAGRNLAISIHALREEGDQRISGSMA